MEKFDVAIIGGGILGTAISYWISLLYDLRVCVIEKEKNVAIHTSSRNTENALYGYQFPGARPTMLGDPGTVIETDYFIIK